MPEAAFLVDGAGIRRPFEPLSHAAEGAELILSVNSGWATAVVDDGIASDGPSDFSPVTAVGLFFEEEPGMYKLWEDRCTVAQQGQPVRLAGIRTGER